MNIGKAANLLLRNSGLLGMVVNRIRYPGLKTAAGVEIVRAGLLEYGDGISIMDRARLLVATGTSLKLHSGCYIGRDVELATATGTGIVIGHETSIQDSCVIVGDVSIGSYCILSLRIMIGSGRHYFGFQPELLMRDQDANVHTHAELAAQHSKKVFIGEDCWIGINSVILPGVTIGRGCVIGANSVVTRSVPPYSIVVGSPARISGQRLVFAPPISVAFDEVGDLPYFYFGFECSQREQEQNRDAGGLVAAGRFAVWLAEPPGGTLRLRARGLANCVVVVSGHGAVYPLDEHWTECVFPVSGAGPYWFGSDGGRIAVQAAWVE
jgi:acetyltransferase-like isoleucine patch superfamily enzyme